jgi:2-hydroxychromene-2-carboxylate isomerase
MPAPIDFYFDFSSPYGYVASHRIDAIAAKHGRAVAWRPFLLGAVFKVAGTGPLTNYPLKGDYSVRDFQRSARQHGIPFKMPTKFPVNGLLASRVYYWLEQTAPHRAKPFAKAAYAAYFVEDRDITAAAVIGDAATQAGVDPAAALAATDIPEIKNRLRQVTDEAIQGRGVFGSPFVIVDGEPFWGSDRLDMVDRWLATGGW